MKQAKLVKLNLGCGRRYLPAYINCDVVNTVKVDKVFDLNTFPYPFPQDYVDEILMDNVLEHLDEIVTVMEEVYRILKHKGVLRIYVPYFKSDGAFQDPTHKHYFTEKTMNYFSNDDAYNYYSTIRFEIVIAKPFCATDTLKGKIKNLVPFKFLLNHFLFNVYDGIYFELRAIK